jgi:spermidine synthase
MDAFGWAETALAATVFISMFAYEYLPFWFYKLSSTLARTPAAYPLYELAQGVICFIVMFIPAVCLGTTLPLASRIATAELSRTGRSVGRIFAVNTLGTVLGAAVTGLWLMPTFGLASTFAIGFVMNAAIGAAILLRGQLARFGRTTVIVGAFAALVVITLAGAYFDPRWRGSFTQGVWRTRSNFDFQRFLAQRENMEFLYYKDGPGATIALHNYKNDTNYISLRVNGKADASTFDAGTQLLLGHLPALLHTKATNALVVGLGSGMTCGALLRHTNILQTDVVEISREVVEAAPLWGHHNDNVMKNPRLKVTIEDAKSFLKSSDRKFDIIVNEPSNPWMAGVAAVFSKEFYETCSERLATNGVMAQWVQIYETSDEALRTVVKTFSESFPFISIWRAQAGDIILVGSRQVRGNNVEALLEQMGNPQVQPDLARGGFSEPYAFLTREVMSEQNGAFLARPETAVHSDYYPTLEYVSQVAFFAGANTTLFELYDETRSPRSATHLGALLRERPPGEEDFKRLARASLDREIPDGRLTLSLMERWAETSTNSTLPVEMIERIGASRPAAVVEEMRLAPRHEWMLEQARTDIAVLQFYERVLMRAYRANRTIFHTPNTQKLEQVLGLLLERDPVNRRVYNLHFSELAWDKGDDQACLRFGAIGFNPDVNQSGPLRFTLDELAPRQTLCNMIEASLRMGDLRQARNLAEQAQRGGYLRPGELFFPPLEFICRKVQTIVEAK